MPSVNVAAASLSLALGLASLALIVAAVATNSWVEEEGSTSGLWKNCDQDGQCSNVYIGLSRKYAHYEMVRGFSVCGCAMGLLGVVLCLLSFCSKTKVGASVVGTAFIVEAFFVVTAVSLFTNIRTTYNNEFNWGYSFILGWTAFPCSILAGGLMMFVETIKSD